GRASSAGLVVCGEGEVIPHWRTARPAGPDSLRLMSGGAQVAIVCLGVRRKPPMVATVSIRLPVWPIGAGVTRRPCRGVHMCLQRMYTLDYSDGVGPRCRGWDPQRSQPP